MRRRDLIKVVAGSAITWPLVARAQQAAMPVVGFLHASSADTYAKEAAAVRDGLRDTGYTEGQNVTIEYRWADGHYDRLPALADDLVRRHVAVILAAPSPAARAAKEATSDIPIVFESGADPVYAGLVTSLNRPGGNVSGIFNLTVGLVEKRIEIMHQVVPNAVSIAVLINPANPSAEQVTSYAQGTQTQLGITIEILRASTLDEINAAFARAVELRTGALVVGADPYINSQSAQIAESAVRYNMPVCGEVSDLTRAGGLMIYGADLGDAYRLSGTYAGRVLKGEKPADLPVQQSTKIEMIVNLKTAKALGITIPLPLLGRADEVIE
jgi:putative tryptophan/tyrosine transport system substrate-binding protein